jgi:predicted flap endonuclease-1-like 5' DNA nuclease
MIEQNHEGDLERVKGIGPKTAMLLAAEGIVDLASLVNLDDARIAEIAKRRPVIAERLLREQWREQAASVLAGLVD